MEMSELSNVSEAKTTIFSVLTIAFFCIIPCSGMVAEVSAAILFTVYFCFYPDSLRSRSGSLMPAFCLTAFVWLCAAVTIVLSFVGAIEL